MASVPDVTEELRKLEDMTYHVIGGTRRLARQGLAMADRIREIEQIGAAHVRSSTGAADDGGNKRVGGWVTFPEFMQVMESALFSLKAYGPTAKRAAELLRRTTIYSSMSTLPPGTTSSHRCRARKQDGQQAGGE